ncbi:iron chaperone [Neptunicella sp. SCSIO 80796]|uniref:iron chaperone n=1 Tax=Neptunicella plasticusilytica TaxID=3117012 RepID=UPI003A4D5A53
MSNSDLKSVEIDDYISTQSADARKALEELRTVIWQNSPYVCELMNYNIPAFALVEGGKREQQIMIAGYKKHVGFYPHPDVIEEFKEQLSGFKYAKGSIQFPLNKPLPKELVANMVKCRVVQLEK